MKRIKNLALGVLAALALAPMLQTQITQAAPFGSAFNYQGRLNFSGSPASNGLYDFRFALHSDATTGAPVGTPTTVTLSAVPVTNGLFTVQLDFGAAAFTSGEARWLELAVRTNGVTSLITLTPRQRLTPTPQAIYAGSATTAATASGVAAGAVTSSGLAPGAVGGTAIADGAITSADLNASLLNNTFWKLTGNDVAPGQFIGSTNNQALDIRVLNQRALRLEPRGAGLAPNMLGGYFENTAGSFLGAAIAGGGTSGAINSADGNYSFIGAGIGGHTADSAAVVGGAYNSALGQSSFVGAGLLNTNRGRFAGVVAGTNNFVGPTAEGAFIGGGVRNRAVGVYSTISGGGGNTSSGTSALVGGGGGNTSSAEISTVGGGGGNTSSEYGATVGGGERNTSSGQRSTVGGGEQNTSSLTGSTVGGGSLNTSSGAWATVGGGDGNTSSGHYSTVPGGLFNTADGRYSFAAGYSAKANHAGSFVWADSTFGNFASTADDQFLIRASGGVGIGTTNPGALLQVGDVNTPNSQGMIRLASRSGTGPANRYWDIGVPEGDEDADGKFYSFVIDDPQTGTAPELVIRWNTGDVGIGTDSPQQKLHVVGNIVATGTITPNSDRNAKMEFAPVDTAAILARVARLDIQQWRFKAEAVGVKHVGPMAQDFHAAFGLGEIPTAIATVDADGVALAAIQGLNQKLDEIRAENVELKQRLEKLEQLMNQQNGGDR